MQIVRSARDVAKRILLGPPGLPQQCVVGLPEPQTEVRVQLHGMGDPRDITNQHFMACGAPFLIGITTDATANQQRVCDRVALMFHDRNSDGLLGTIRLQFHSMYRVGSERFCVFRIASSRNYCLPMPRLWGQYYQYSRVRNKTSDADVPITAAEVRAMMVFYTCPRPVVLVSAEDGDQRNIFPMNLMGQVGSTHLAFGLNSSRAAAPLVERASRIAISDVPISMASTARELGSNHRKVTIEWSDLKFAVKESPEFGIPVPIFALRVREVEVTESHRVGSHTLFVGRVMHSTQIAESRRFFIVHGMYEAWRRRMMLPDLDGAGSATGLQPVGGQSAMFTSDAESKACVR